MTILTIKEIAEKLKLNKVTVQKMCKAGTIPAFRIGKMWRIDGDDFEKWYREQGAEKTGVAPADKANEVTE